MDLILQLKKTGLNNKFGFFVFYLQELVSKYFFKNQTISLDFIPK